jgi:multiple sugar transport system substrate-binding protein
VRAISLVAAVVLIVLGPLSGCGLTHQDTQDTAGPIRLTLWEHDSTTEEQAALTAQVASFEAAHPRLTVDLKITAAQADYKDTYKDALQAAIAANQLPDVFDIDGPNIASYAYQGALMPLDDLLGAQVRDRMLPSLVTQGTWRGHLWAVGAFDSGLAMWGDRAALTRAGVRIPTGPDDAWTATEMTAALAALAADDPDGLVLDLGLSDMSTEQATYFFAPLLYSAGAALIDPATGRATGTLDSPAAVAAMTDLARWATYADPDKDGAAFTGRRAALAWSGHWRYPSFAAVLGPDLVLIPLPDLGRGTKSGQGSWAWGIGAGTTHPAAAAALVDWLTDDANATAMTDANGAVPGTRAALAASARYGPGKPLHLFGDQLARTCGDGPYTAECVTVPRPITPAYPTITAAFAAAALAVIQGGNPQQSLSTAARSIDTTVELNHGYTESPTTP